jgi:hypothetical protein
MRLLPVLSLSLITIGLHSCAFAQAALTTKDSSPYIQKFQAKNSPGSRPGRFVSPDFKISHQNGVAHLVGQNIVINATADATGIFTSNTRIALPGLPVGVDPLMVFLTKAAGMTCLSSDFYYQAVGNAWKKIGVVPTRFAWNFRWGGVEALDNGNLLFITGNNNRFELVDPGTWKAVFSSPYAGSKGPLQSSPTPFREPVSSRVNDKVVIFYPFSASGEVLVFDASENSVVPVQTPWEKNAKSVLTSSSGKRHSDRPVIAQWYPIDSENVGFIGVNGDSWYAYLLDLRSLTWTPWDIKHDGWLEPYGIPVENHRLMHIDHFGIDK